MTLIKFLTGLAFVLAVPCSLLGLFGLCVEDKDKGREWAEVTGSMLIAAVLSFAWLIAKYAL